METKRLTEWLGTADGLVKVAAGLIGSFGTLIAAVTGQLKPLLDFIGLPQTALPIVVVAIIVGLILYFWRGYRRFARLSKLEQPDRFTLVATTPESLIGRADDLQRLLRVVAQNRIVLLDGESGCGKSALVGSGLIPKLQSANGLLPILVRDWGDDWVRGPLAATLEALYGALTAAQRERIEWSPAPDLAAPARALADELSQRLDAINEKLERRPLLIADQFDDYQAPNREHFLDADGNWTTPTKLAESNPYWGLCISGFGTGSSIFLPSHAQIPRLACHASAFSTTRWSLIGRCPGWGSSISGHYSPVSRRMMQIRLSSAIPKAAGTHYATFWRRISVHAGRC